MKFYISILSGIKVLPETQTLGPTNIPSRDTRFHPHYLSSSFPREPKSISPHTLLVSNPTPFKRQKWKNRKGRMGIPKISTQADSGGWEWPSPSPTPADATSGPSGWAQPQHSVAPPQPITAEEKAKHLAMQMQHRVLDICRRHFKEETVGSGGDGMGDEDGEEDDDDDEEHDGGEMEVGEDYKFLLDVFVKEAELRDYYERNYEDGEFCCFVCGGVNGVTKGVKKFKSCNGLLQHAISISKTKKRRAHRAFALVICKVLGWDVDRLPVIVLKGESLGQTLNLTSPQDSSPLQAPDVQWPTKKVKECPDSAEWPSLKSDAANRSASPEEQEKLAAEQKVLEACREFFSCQSSVEVDDLEDEHAEDDCTDEVDPVDIESEELKFFMRLFTDDLNLRGYYQNSYVDGDFCCLVCSGVGKKTWRRFKGCTALVNHSKTIWKVNQKAHRAYAVAVCKVLGWDVKQLPEVVGDGETHSRAAEKSADVKDSVPLPTSGFEWPCEDVKDGAVKAISDWPILKSHAEPISAEEKEKIAAEQKVLEACCNFFGNKYGSECDDNEDNGDLMDHDEDDDDDEEEGQDKECREFKFFMNLFTEDSKLRGYYENNSGDGDFCCLVCAGVGKKTWKRYKGCTGLLHHAKSILGLKIRAHRAYGQAVCKLLGWDINQPPKINCSSKPLTHSLENSTVQGSATLPASDAEWPCENIGPYPGSTASGWPAVKPALDPISSEEKEKLAAEQKVLGACRDFFRHKYHSECNDDEDDNSEEEDENHSMDEDDEEDDLIDEECEDFKFFMKLFTEDAKLRGYYENRYIDGDFACLVCGGVGKKVWRRFKGCTVLVNHSNTIWKTKKAAHRAYAMAVCKVLGWDINQLPRPSTSSLEKPAALQEVVPEAAASAEDDED